jgi:hypothetical protein
MCYGVGMLIGFIGTPCSGKTTIAAKLFASMKEIGMKTELIVEQARTYIANKRFQEGISYKEKVILTNEDQLSIYKLQSALEFKMKNSCSPDTVIITDTCAFNAGIYTDETFELNHDRKFFTNAVGHYDLIFYCHPINLRFLPEDSNRIHSLEEIQKLDKRTLEVIDACHKNNFNVFDLLGSLSLEQRYLKASHEIMELYANVASSM